MPAQSDPANLSVGQFAERYRREMIPLGKQFSYYFAALPLTDEDIKEYLEEPIAALPASIASKLPRVSILLVPYLEKVQGRDRAPASRSNEMVRLEKPSQNRVSWTSCTVSKEETLLAFALKDQEVADYHYRFYHLLAALTADHWTEDAQAQYFALVREELGGNVHGEVDEESWHLKQALVRRTNNLRRETKLFREYARQSFIDTLTLYLHGICCDIDVETGPRQLPSRFLRKRLTLLQQLYPPPGGYAIFPEEKKIKK
jgi:hypothetical protein